MTTRRRPWLGPGALLVAAALIVGARLIASLAGLDETLVVLSGMHPTGWSELDAVVACTLYVLAHLGAVLLAPVLVLAALIDATFSAIARRRARASAGSSGSRAG